METIKIDEYANRPYLLSKHSFAWENPSYNALRLIQDFYDANEHQLYFGYIKSDEIEYEHLSEIENQVKYWIDNKMWTPFEKNPVHAENLAELEKKMIAKQVYLFGEYQNSGKKWRYPMTVHYNPRQGTFVAHPGGTRTRILSLIGAEKTRVWYHTIDKNIQPKGEFQPVSVIDIRKVNKDNTHDMVIDFVPDHGSFIPHIAYDLGLRPKYLVKSQNNIVYNLSRSNICSNTKELKIFNTFVVRFRKYKSRTWMLTVTNYSIKSELNCFFSLCNGKNYKDDNMSLRLCN